MINIEQIINNVNEMEKKPKRKIQIILPEDIFLDFKRLCKDRKQIMYGRVELLILDDLKKEGYR